MANTIIRSGSTILNTYPNRVVLKNTMQGITDKICIYTEEYIDINKRFFDTQGYNVIKREPELKPCPVCGSSNNLEIDDDARGYSIGCDSCEIEQAIFYPTKQDAIEAWNALPRKGE